MFKSLTYLKTLLRAEREARSEFFCGIKYVWHQTGAVAGFVFGGGQAPRGPAPRGPRVPPKPENYADLAHYFSERAQIVE